jgi:8-oxo-dGTP diphosphatase
MAFYFMSDEFSGEPVSSAEGELEWCNIEDSFMKDGVSDFYIKISPFVFKQDKNFIGLIRVNKNGEITNLNIF